MKTIISTLVLFLAFFSSIKGNEIAIPETEKENPELQSFAYGRLGAYTWLVLPIGVEGAIGYRFRSEGWGWDRCLTYLQPLALVLFLWFLRFLLSMKSYTTQKAGVIGTGELCRVLVLDMDDMNLEVKPNGNLFQALNSFLGKSFLILTIRKDFTISPSTRS